MNDLFLLLLLIIGLLFLASPVTLIIGLYKIFFQKENKKQGIQLLTFSIVILIIGFGTCFSFLKSGF